LEKIRRIVVGTRNAGKLREIRSILGRAGLEILSLEDLGDDSEVEETGRTFAENARIKALGFARSTGETVLGEDSGLEVDALGGAPGVYSARFAGEPQDPEANNALLLDRMQKIEEAERSARYRCAVCLASPDRVIAEAAGDTEGFIAMSAIGTGGFGYDPLFLSEDLGQSFGEAPAEAKHAVSHRGRALHALVIALEASGLL
jgi:XTP/dITP diphosphohydrolase